MKKKNLIKKFKLYNLIPLLTLQQRFSILQWHHDPHEIDDLMIEQLGVVLFREIRGKWLRRNN